MAWPAAWADLVGGGRRGTEVVGAFFLAMQTGRAAADELLALFDDDAEYVEPFSGGSGIHRGRAAIRAAFERGWERELPEQRIVVDRVDVEGGEVVARWTCFSPGLPGGRGSGVNRFELSGGRIIRLRTTWGERWADGGSAPDSRSRCMSSSS
ncbi:MAG: nuclear transport factor 2 family protein [Myxococcota bacterium]